MSISFSDAISRMPLKSFQVATFAICMLVLICDGVDAQLLGIVAPVIIDELGVDRTIFGVAMSSALVGFGLGSWAGGWLGDRFGRRWSLALATVVFSLGTVGASLADGVWALAVWRLVGGLGFGSAYANAITLAAEWLPDRWRSVGVTTLSVGTPAGGLVVAALAPTLVDAFGWRGSFVVIGLATLLVVILVVGVLRDSPSYLLARGRTEAAGLAARKVLDEDLALVPDQHHADRGEHAVGVFDRSNLRLNVGLGIAFAAATMVAYGVFNWATTFLTAKGFTFENASYAVSIAGLASIVSSIAAGVLVQRFGSRPLVMAMSGGLLATLVLLAFMLETMPVVASAFQRAGVVALVGLAAAIFSAGIASFYAMMAYGYPAACRSAGIGFGIFVGRAGAIAASGLGGWLIDLGGGSLVPFFIVLCVGAGLMSTAAFVVDRHVPPAMPVR